MTTYGTVLVDGTTYELTGQADFTTRLLPCAYINYHDADDGEMYDFEMSAPAQGADGTRYIVYWLFEGIKGDDEGLDSYDFTIADRVVRSD